MGTVDTLKAYEVLTAAEMPEKQARAMVSIVQDLQEARLVDLATKGDIAALHSDLRETEARLRAEMAAHKADLLKWLITLMIGQTAFLVGVLKFLK